MSAHQAEVLAGFVRMAEALKDALPTDLTEVVALPVTTHSGNDYEHCALAANVIQLPPPVPSIFAVGTAVGTGVPS